MRILMTGSAPDGTTKNYGKLGGRLDPSPALEAVVKSMLNRDELSHLPYCEQKRPQLHLQGEANDRRRSH